MPRKVRERVYISCTRNLSFLLACMTVTASRTQARLLHGATAGDKTHSRNKHLCQGMRQVKALKPVCIRPYLPRAMAKNLAA